MWTATKIFVSSDDLGRWRHEKYSGYATNKVSCENRFPGFTPKSKKKNLNIPTNDGISLDAK